MKLIRQPMKWVFVLTCIVAFVMACGDDELTSENDANTANTDQAPENQNSEEQGQGSDDCEENQSYNPILGECVDAGGAENQEEQNQESVCDDVDCDEGLYCDPGSGECVECIGDGHCEAGYVCSNANECIPESEAPEDCTSDDDCEEGEQCNEEVGQCEDKEEEFACGPGAIVGETCTADDGILPHAHVVVEGYDCDGTWFSGETVADENGSYEFEDVPSGTHELTISSGSFEVTDDVSVQAGEVTDLTGVGTKLCFTGSEVDIAVIPGSWDDIGGLLNNMNIDYDEISSETAFFSDLDQMEEYDIIFVACATDAGIGSAGFDADTDEMAYNIRRYVETGHSLYVSDFSAPVLQFVIPEAFEFYNGETVGGPRVGSGNQEVVADVVSDEMKTVLDKDTVDINFDTIFVVLEAMGEHSEEQFRSDLETSDGYMEDRPLMGVYDDPIGQGRAIFTSFHNSAQITGDVEDILEYMIFQL